MSAILTEMSWWRHSRLVRTVAMVLLVWTATDISNASLCALDSEGAGPFALRKSSGTSIPVQAPGHVDDCFCCSHCVDVQTVVSTSLAMPANLDRTPLIASAPRIFGSPVYHPPLI